MTSPDLFALLPAGEQPPTARRLARVVADVRSAAAASRRRVPAGAVRPVDLVGWERTLEEGLRLAPELPAWAWRGALLGAWPDDGADGFAPAVASSPVTLVHLAAVLAWHAAPERPLAPSARRRAVAVLCAAGPMHPTTRAARPRSRVDRWTCASTDSTR